MKKLFLCCAALLTVSLTQAAEVFFRSGKILRTELLKSQPAKFKNYGLEEPPKGAVYAAVTVELDNGRKIGIFDYSLRVDGREYECAAIRDDRKRTFSDVSGGGNRFRCTLFFVLDASDADNAGQAFLVCKAPGGGDNVELNFAPRQ